jgi:hypothetical protein
MVDFMENSKPTNEQQNESEKLSTDTTIGSCSELLPRLKGKTLFVPNLETLLEVDYDSLQLVYDNYKAPTQSVQ